MFMGLDEFLISYFSCYLHFSGDNEHQTEFS